MRPTPEKSIIDQILSKILSRIKNRGSKLGKIRERIEDYYRKLAAERLSYEAR